MLVVAGLEKRDDIIESCERGSHAQLNELKQRLGYDDATYNAMVYNIRRKFCEIFDYKFVEYNDEQDDSDNEFIF